VEQILKWYWFSGAKAIWRL